MLVVSYIVDEVIRSEMMSDGIEAEDSLLHSNLIAPLARENGWYAVITKVVHSLALSTPDLPLLFQTPFSLPVLSPINYNQ